MSCPSCWGTGYRPATTTLGEREWCSTCSGTGMVPNLRRRAFWRGVRTGYLWGVVIGLPLLVVACVTSADLRRWEGALREAGQPEAADEVAVDARETEQAEQGGLGALEITLGALGLGGIGAALLRRQRSASA